MRSAEWLLKGESASIRDTLRELSTPDFGEVILHYSYGKLQWLNNNQRVLSHMI